MKISTKPGILAGLLVGFLLTAALIALFYAAWKLAGLPFVPFDVFDWMTRKLPGPVIAFGIDSMVKVIRALNIGPTASSAKLAEQSMAVGGMLLTGMIAGAVLFGIVRILQGRHSRALGIIFGTALGIAALLISHQLSHTATAPPAINAVWILVLCVGWGAVLGWSCQRLNEIAAVETAPGTDASAVRLDRRRFIIRLGGASALITVAGATVGVLSERGKRQPSNVARNERWSANHPLPNADAAVKPAPGTRPEFTPLELHYRIDINTTPPVINADDWKLEFSGLMDQPMAFTLDQLRRFEPMHQFITLACISNPVGGDLIGTTRWTGVSLQRLLPELRLKPNATHLKISSADGFYEFVSLKTIQDDERVMLAYDWDGVPLLPEHGFPLRIYVPDVYGMKQPKWIQSIEAVNHWEPGYWVTRGWDEKARMKATSVIDTVAVNMTIVGADQRTLVPIGGIAHAGDRGISKVEVQVDDGPWHQAALRTPLSKTTWVIWRYDWPFQHGRHTFIVCCYEGDGTPQSATPTPMEPDGAAGLYDKTQMF